MTVTLTGQAQTGSPYIVGPGNDRNVDVTRDGALFVSTYYDKLVAMGRVFVCNVGTVTTPVTFLITAANRPDWAIRVASGSMIRPLCVETVLEAAAGTATELDIRQAYNDIGNGTSSAMDVPPINLRTDLATVATSTGIIARKLYTADATAETTPVSLHRKTWPLAQASGLMDYTDFWIPTIPPYLVGPATLEGFLAATTTQATGFVQIYFADLSPTLVTG